jgi:hypothetical protein
MEEVGTSMHENATRVEEHTDQGAREVIRGGGGKEQGAADRDCGGCRNQSAEDKEQVIVGSGQV